MNLLAYLEGEPGDLEVKRVEALAHGLRTDFLLETPPRFVNEGGGLERTVGVLLIVPPPSDDPETERRAFAEVVRLVEAVEQFTASSDDVFAWELDGQVVGWVEAGERDQMLAGGLIDPWRRRIEHA